MFLVSWVVGVLHERGGKMGKQCLMKVATYHIWNNEEQDKRKKHILQELHMADADVVGLQEVTDVFYEDVLKIRFIHTVVFMRWYCIGRRWQK